MSVGRDVPRAAGLLLCGAAAAWLSGCGSPCGPSEGVVSHVIDGDTVELESGERLRYLLVDTPEITGGKNECFGAQAAAFNRSLVEGRKISISYGEVCTDRYERALVYVKVDGQDVNRELVRQGYGCVLHLPPGGDGRVDEFLKVQEEARNEGSGLWATCSARPAACPG